MTRHSDEIRLRHMLDHAVEAVDIARGRTREDLDSDRQLNLSLVRLLEIGGEAAGRVTEEMRRRHSDIPWPDIVSLRNRLVHGYDRGDLDIVWDSVHDDLPPRIAKLEKVFGADSSRETAEGQG